VKWFRDTFASPNLSYETLDAEMPTDPTRLLVLPHFDPPPWPQYIPNTSGIIMGLKTGTKRGEILKAIRESVALYFVEGMTALKNIGCDTTEFIASGGGSTSDLGLQIRADIFGIPMVRPRITEAGLLGTALLAGTATGVFQTLEESVELFVQRDRVFDPNPARHTIYQEKHALYRQLFDTNRKLLKQL